MAKINKSPIVFSHAIYKPFFLKKAIAAWITLTVHSSLEAVGLTAAFSNALADVGISCNVVAAYYHDHIFVAQKDAQEAMAVIRGLRRGA